MGYTGGGCRMLDRDDLSAASIYRISCDGAGYKKLFFHILAVCVYISSASANDNIPYSKNRLKVKKDNRPDPGQDSQHNIVTFRGNIRYSNSQGLYYGRCGNSKVSKRKSEVLQVGLSPGAFIAFFAALFSLIKPIKKLSRVHVLNQQALAAGDRIFEILDQKPNILERKDAVILKPFKDKIIFEEAYFSYDGIKPILENISLEAKRGRIIAI